jgi:hypothetical protein
MRPNSAFERPAQINPIQCAQTLAPLLCEDPLQRLINSTPMFADLPRVAGDHIGTLQKLIEFGEVGFRPGVVVEARPNRVR